MLPQHVLIALVAAVGAVPLNINLGAYSPALVVGDGEISLGAGGAEGASELMATLAQGAQQGAQQGQQEQPAGEEQQGGEAPAEAPAEGEAPAEAPAEGEQPAEGEAAKRSNLARAINMLRKREAEPVNEHLAAVEAATQWIKRDIDSFNAALSYAREAMKDQPKVEMGTENAGIGMIVNAGINVPANSAANGAGAGEGEARKVKRDDVVAEESEAPKMTLVAITEV